MSKVAGMKIYSQELGMAATNVYLFLDEDTGRAVVFDAPERAFEFVDLVRKETPFEVDALFLTHGHWDHMLDAWRFSEAGIPVYGHPDDQPLFEEAEAQRGFTFGERELKSVKINHWLRVEEPLSILGKATEVRHVPGHCPGNVLFYLPEMELAVVGDAIFAGSIGRTDLPGGSMELLEKSIRDQIYSLPEQTRLLPGHGPVTSVGQERATNPFVSG